jgi:hypothetical protein
LKGAEMPNQNNNRIDTEDSYGYNYQTDKCAVRKCKWESHDTNNEGALDLITQGGYGDFMDYYDESPVYFRLCHKHAHQFSSWLNNTNVLPRHNGHAHNGSEPGFWYGHIGWDQYTWLSYLNNFFYHLLKENLKFAIGAFNRQLRHHITWTKQNINDKTTPVVKKRFIFKLFFLDKAYKGFVNTKLRQAKVMYRNWIKKTYRNYISLDREIWEKVLQGKLSDKDLEIMAHITDANRSNSEEE